MSGSAARRLLVQAVSTSTPSSSAPTATSLWMHDDQWEGQRWNRSPGNLYSAPRNSVDPRRPARRADRDKVIPPIEKSRRHDYVKRFKFQSPSLTKFWGRPIYLGAVVLLPRDYEHVDDSYPVNYIQGHFSLAAPYGFDEKEISPKRGSSDDFPRMIAVTFQHPTPYFDDSYASTRSTSARTATRS